MKDAVKDRIKSILEDNHLSINAASKVLNVNYRTLNHQLNGKSEVSLDTLFKLKELFPEYSLDWIITGTDSKPDRERRHDCCGEETPETCRAEDRDGIPLYRAKAVACFGGKSGFNECDIESRYRIREFSAATFMVYISGDSMSPHYNSGDIIAVKIMRDFDHIQWGKPYLVSCKNGVFVKRLYQGDGHIIAISDNPSYAPVYIKQDSIAGIAAVIGCVKPEYARQARR